MNMFDKLDDIVNRYEDITAELSNPDVVNDQTRFRKLMSSTFCSRTFPYVFTLCRL